MPTGSDGGDWAAWSTTASLTSVFAFWGQLRTPTACKMNAGGQALCGQPESWLPAPGGTAREQQSRPGCSPGPWAERASPSAAPPSSPGQERVWAPGQMPHCSGRGGRRQGPTWGPSLEWKQAFGRGSPSHSPPSPTVEAPGSPPVLMKRQRDDSPREGTLETVCSVLSPVPGDLRSFLMREGV